MLLKEKLKSWRYRWSGERDAEVGFLLNLMWESSRAAWSGRKPDDLKKTVVVPVYDA